MFDDSFCCLRSVRCKNWNGIPKGVMDARKLIRFSGLVVEPHKLTSVYAGYACGNYL